MIKRKLEIILITISFLLLTLVYLFPLTQGLILLPLDLLISNYSPWYSPGTILLKNPYMQDSIVQLFPWRHLVFQSLTNNIIPLWNPYQNMGVPFMASLKPMVFYPLNLLFVLGEVKAWNTLLFSQIFLSMLFSYMLARDFKLGVLPGMLVSFAFALNSLMIGLLEFGSDGHTLLWWPLIFLFAKRYLEKNEGKYLFFLGMILSFSIFSGQLQYMGYALALLVGFILFYGYKLKVKISIYFLAFLSISLGIGISAVQLIPSIELFTQSHRGLSDPNQIKEVFTKSLITPYQLSRLLSPDFFGNPVTRDSTIGYIETSGYFGIIPFFFSLFAIFFGRKNPLVRFFMITFIIALALSIKGIGEILYFLKIPVLTSGEGGRIFSLALFSGAILSGFGLAEFLKIRNWRKNILSVCIFTAIFIIVVGISTVADNPLTGSDKNFIHNLRFASFVLGIFFVGTLIYVCMVVKSRSLFLKIIFMIFVVGLTFFDLFRLGYRFLTFSNEKFLYPEMGVTKFVQETSKGTLARNFGLTEPELATYLNVYTVETYNPLYLSRTGIFLQALQGKLNERLSVDNKYLLTSKEDNLKRTLDFLGVSFIVVGKDENVSIRYFKTEKFESNFQLIYKDNQYVVYKNLTSYPRFDLYYQTQEVKDDSEALQIISQGSIDFTKKLLIEKGAPSVLGEGSGSVKLVDSTINTQKFMVNTDQPAFFYISDTFSPGWKALVNGQDTKIYRANYNFRAVLVPSGNSILEFAYVPNTILIGSLVSVLSLLLLFALGKFYYRFHRSSILE